MLRPLPLTGLFCALVALQVSSALAARIEADPAKEYPLTRNRGPWMIMIATFHSAGDDGEVKEGKTPEEAARELVLELRQLGLPAYSYSYQPENDRIVTQDRLGRQETRKNLHLRRTVCVIAGNYGDINDKVAQDTLKWVKKVNPKCLQQGVTFIPTPGRPGPLAGAFLTPNPLLNESEIYQKQRDPLLVQLNSGERFSLYENKGKQTLVIARFYGKQKTLRAGEKEPHIMDFLKDNDLDNAARGATELTTVLRGRYDVSPGQPFNNVEAYVWHDHHESIVTVGSFDGPNDPRIQKYMAIFGPRLMTEGPTAGTAQPAHFAVANFREGETHAMWIFEPNPQLMAVPTR